MVDAIARLVRAEKSRAILFQALALGAVVLFAFFIFQNTVQNLSERGIASGFGFLDQPAGYDISFKLIDYELTDTHGRIFFVGLFNTLLVAGLGIVLATVLGLIVGILRLSGNWLVGGLMSAYVEVLRNVPLLLQILFWYAVMLALPTVRESLSLGDVVFLNNRGMELPTPVFGDGMALVGGAGVLALLVLIGVLRWNVRVRERTGTAALSPLWLSAIIIGLVLLPFAVFMLIGAPLTWDVPEAGRFNFSGGLTVPPSFTALLLALTTYTAAFIGEIVRAGIQSVARGQREAALALGLGSGQTMRLVILPQALRVIIPPVTSQYLNLTKNSSLGVVIGYPDIVATFGGTTLNQTGQAIETLAMVMGFYLTVSLLISLVMNWYNRRVRLKGGMPA